MCVPLYPESMRNHTSSRRKFIGRTGTLFFCSVVAMHAGLGEEWLEVSGFRSVQTGREKILTPEQQEYVNHLKEQGTDKTDDELKEWVYQNTATIPVKWLMQQLGLYKEKRKNPYGGNQVDILDRYMTAMATYTVESESSHGTSDVQLGTFWRKRTGRRKLRITDRVVFIIGMEMKGLVGADGKLKPLFSYLETGWLQDPNINKGKLEVTQFRLVHLLTKRKSDRDIVEIGALMGELKFDNHLFENGRKKDALQKVYETLYQTQYETPEQFFGCRIDGEWITELTTLISRVERLIPGYKNDFQKVPLEILHRRPFTSEEMEQINAATALLERYGEKSPIRILADYMNHVGMDVFKNTFREFIDKHKDTKKKPLKAQMNWEIRNSPVVIPPYALMEKPVQVPVLAAA